MGKWGADMRAPTACPFLQAAVASREQSQGGGAGRGARPQGSCPAQGVSHWPVQCGW